jgi:hypothetical protein
MTALDFDTDTRDDDSLQPGEAALLHERNARILGVLLIAYLGLLTILGVGFGVRLTIYALVVSVGLVVSMALLRSRTGSRWAPLRAWVPYLVLAMAYELIRGFAPAILSRVDTDDIPGLERLLFGGRIATELLQTALRPLSGFDPLAAGASIVYMLHTPLPLVVGAYFWWRRRRLFYDYLAALIILSMAAFTTYLVFPAAPPWWAAASGHLAGPSGLPLISYLKPDAFSSLGTSAGIDGKALFTLAFGDISPDPVAAFPSLHAAYPLLAYLFMRRLGGPAAWAMLAFTLAAWFSIVYLGDHYVIDILGGVLYVAIVYRLLPTLDRLLGIGHGSAASSAGVEPGATRGT